MLRRLVGDELRIRCTPVTTRSGVLQGAPLVAGVPSPLRSSPGSAVSIGTLRSRGPLQLADLGLDLVGAGVRRRRRTPCAGPRGASRAASPVPLARHARGRVLHWTAAALGQPAGPAG